MPRHWPPGSPADRTQPYLQPVQDRGDHPRRPVATGPMARRQRRAPMRHFKPTREFFIPKGAVKITDKHSDAVAYVYSDQSSRLYGMVFFGKQGKPVFHYRYRDTTRREAAITST